MAGPPPNATTIGRRTRSLLYLSHVTDTCMYVDTHKQANRAVSYHTNIMNRQGEVIVLYHYLYKMSRLTFSLTVTYFSDIYSTDLGRVSR